LPKKILDMEFEINNTKCWINKDEWEFYRQWRAERSGMAIKNIINNELISGGLKEVAIFIDNYNENNLKQNI